MTDVGRAVAHPYWSLDPDDPLVSAWMETESMREALDARRTPGATSISTMSVSNWRQFSLVDILFHPRLTVLTGANGAGKTTLLNLLAPHFNWQAQLLVGRQGKLQEATTPNAVGELRYSNGTHTSFVEQPGAGIRNAPLSMPSAQAVPGVFINSHRSVSSYQPLTALPPRFSESEAILQQFASEIQTRYLGGGSQYSPLYRMKEALVAAAMHAYGNVAVRPDPAAQEVWEGYQRVLRRFLPAGLGFTKLQVDDAEIILVTSSGDFPLEAVSGGMSAMLELSWQIFLRQRNQAVFTVCIDEPENHLHPELQRSIMPSLIAAFPGVSFIVATHSPLVVTSVQDAFVYALRSDADGNVASARVVINSSATPDETLTSIFGLDTTLPLWAEDQLSDLMSDLGESPSVEQLRRFRDSLRELGLDRQFPAAVNSLGRQQDDD